MGCLCKEVAGPNIELAEICLGQLWMFENIAEADLKALLQVADRKKRKKGDILFLQSDPADSLFLIKGGRVKLEKVFEDGGELTLDIRKKGDFVGENSLSENEMYPVSAICLEDTLTCGFSKKQFEKLVLNNPNIGLQVIKNLSDRVTWLTSQVGSLAVTNIEERLYRVLCNVAKDHGIKSTKGIMIEFPLTHEDLGFLTGAHRVSITRAMTALKEAGKILFEGRKLILTNTVY